MPLRCPLKRIQGLAPSAQALAKRSLHSTFALADSVFIKRRYETIDTNNYLMYHSGRNQLPGVGINPNPSADNASINQVVSAPIPVARHPPFPCPIPHSSPSASPPPTACD